MLLIISSIFITLFSIYIIAHIYSNDPQILDQFGFLSFIHKKEIVSQAAIDETLNNVTQEEVTTKEELPPPVSKEDDTKKQLNQESDIVVVENFKLGSSIDKPSESILSYEIVRNDDKIDKISGVSVIVMKVDGNYVVLPQGITLSEGIPQWNGKGFTFSFKYRKQYVIKIPKPISSITETVIFLFDNTGKLLLSYNHKAAL
jgi:hypothetical protein